MATSSMRSPSSTMNSFSSPTCGGKRNHRQGIAHQLASRLRRQATQCAATGQAKNLPSEPAFSSHARGARARGCGGCKGRGRGCGRSRWPAHELSGHFSHEQGAAVHARGGREGHRRKPVHEGREG
eukprot:scaffold54285_cov103-Phaeocystis_antarctica.AAC.1